MVASREYDIFCVLLLLFFYENLFLYLLYAFWFSYKFLTMIKLSSFIWCLVDSMQEYFYILKIIGLILLFGKKFTLPKCSTTKLKWFLQYQYYNINIWKNISVYFKNSLDAKFILQVSCNITHEIEISKPRSIENSESGSLILICCGEKNKYYSSDINQGYL